MKSPRSHPDANGHLESVSQSLRTVTEELDVATRALQQQPPESDAVVSAALARRVWTYGSAMCDLMYRRMPPGDSDSFEHLAPLGANARCMGDAFIQFYYFSAEPDDRDEREFRHLLFRRHELQNYLNLIEVDSSFLGAAPPGAVARLRKALAAAHAEIVKHPVFTLRDDRTRSLICNPDRKHGYFRSVFEESEDILQRASMPLAAHTWRHMLGSQVIHSTPFSLSWEASMKDDRDGKIGRWVESFLDWAIDLQQCTVDHLNRMFPNELSQRGNR